MRNEKESKRNRCLQREVLYKEQANGEYFFLLIWVRMCEWEDNNQGTEQETKSANFDYVK